MSLWTEWRCLVENKDDQVGVVVDRSASLGDQSSVSITAGSSQKMKKTVVRKELADTQEYESCLQTDMDVDMDENKEELMKLRSSNARRKF